MACCVHFEKAMQERTDGESHMPLIACEPDGSFTAGCGDLAPLRYCPWCGASFLSATSAVALPDVVLRSIEVRALDAAGLPWRLATEESPTLRVLNAYGSQVCMVHSAESVQCEAPSSVKGNAIFIANAPVDVNALLAEVRRLRIQARQK